MEIHYDAFTELYNNAVMRKNNAFETNGHGTITAAFPANNRVFTDANWNDPLMSIFRNYFYDLASDHSDNPMVDVHLFHEDDQHSLVIEGPDEIYVLSWYKNRGRTEQFYRMSNPSRHISLEDVYEFFIDIEYNAVPELTK